MLESSSKLAASIRISGGHLSAMTWREYHEATKHSVESLRRIRHVLDWANMPDPFRHYEGVPVLDLPADPPILEMPALDVLRGTSGSTPVVDGPAFLSQLFFYSAAISASKCVPSTGQKYALRVNPSSGNLHPTEFHFFTRGLKGNPDGLYHYDPSRHMAEQRGRGCFGMDLLGGAAPIVFVLTSIVWREAWKYGERAYRYCLHDIGHAWQALALSAQAMGCDSFAMGDFPDDEVAQYLRVGRALDWKIGGNHPIASCAIASESESKCEARRDSTAATASASSRAPTSGRFNVERSASGTAAACKGVSISPGSIERTRTPSKRGSSSQMRLK